jgi:hypothetical protein
MEGVFLFPIKSVKTDPEARRIKWLNVENIVILS